MGSRIRENVNHLFQCFCEVVRPQTINEEAWIIQKFPEGFKELEVLNSVPKFAYPCEFKNTVVQHYSFVLTNIDSKWTFGFCRHDPKTETAIVILSYLPWHENFYKLLNHIAEITHSSKSEELWSFLNSVYQSPVPTIEGSTLEVTYNDGQDVYKCHCPSQYALPSIPENRNLTEYYNAVDAHNMMVIFASMLHERRIIFTSGKLCRLSACVQAANALLYPMNWQHIFIPVLPASLKEYLFAPMPYLIGVPEQILEKVRKVDIGDVVVLDADANRIDSPFNDLEELPSEVINALRRPLRDRATLLGDGVSRAFLRALVQLIGGYRDGLKLQEGQKITFDSDAFVEARPLPLQPFLRKMLELQLFQQFVDERLELLNNGLGFSDEFEMEACNYSEKSSGKFKQQYKEWAHNMKKSSAFFKTVKNKANPAMKSAVKSVKERGKEVKTAYKGLRSKLRDSTAAPLPTPVHPRSAPSSPTQSRIRPLTIQKPNNLTTATASYRKDSTSKPRRSEMAPNPSNTSSRPYSPLSPNSAPSSPEAAGTSDLQLSPINMDLMSALEDVIFRKNNLLSSESETPPVDRSLKPVRSLESCRGPAVPRRAPPLSLAASSSGGSASSPEEQPPPLPSNPPPEEQLFHTENPFVIASSQPGAFVLASPSSVDLVRLPPPLSAQSSKDKDNSGDLIRLDSNSLEDEEFDPLLTKDKSAQQPPGTSAMQSTSGTELTVTGLTNPLYPFYTPNKPLIENSSFLYSHGKPANGSLYPSQTCNMQDLDLLKEYGLDLNTLSVDNKDSSSLSGTSDPSFLDDDSNKDPFEMISHSESKLTTRPNQSTWTKFD